MAPADARRPRRLPRRAPAAPEYRRAHPAPGPAVRAGLVLAERTLGLLAEGGFTADQAAEIGSQALCSLVTLLTTEPGASEDPDPDVRDDAIRARRASLAALHPRRYPHIVAAADALTSCADREGYYDLGVDLVVAGMRGVQPASQPR